MEHTLIESIAIHRTVIGYLGEREQFAWWQSSFFTKGSSSFLSPVFGRTQLLAQYNGVSRAAGLVHDQRIGVGSVFHLFRLPEDIEQRIQHILHSSELEEMIRNIIVSKEAVISYLRKGPSTEQIKAIGPTRVGSTKNMDDEKLWNSVFGMYLHAFENSLEIFPYVSDHT